MFVYGATRGRHHGRKATAGRLAQHAFSAFRAKTYVTGRYIRARSKGEHGAKAVYPYKEPARRYGDMGEALYHLW